MDPEKQRRIASLGGKHSHGGGRRRGSRAGDYDYDYRSNEDEDWGSRDSEFGYYPEDEEDDWRSELEDEDYEESA